MLRVFNMRVCQFASHVCAVHNKEQGILLLLLLLLQEKVYSVISIVIPAIFLSYPLHSIPALSAQAFWQN